MVVSARSGLAALFEAQLARAAFSHGMSPVLMIILLRSSSLFNRRFLRADAFHIRIEGATRGPLYVG